MDTKGITSGYYVVLISSSQELGLTPRSLPKMPVSMRAEFKMAAI